MNRIPAIHRAFRAVAMLAAATAFSAAGQTFTWDPTGNAQLTGNYYFRDVIFQADSSGSVFRRILSTGLLNFSGTGTYTGVLNILDSAQGTGTFNTSGTYANSASGHGFMTHPSTSNSMRFVFSNGVLLGSSTDTLTTDLMIMVPATPAATAATFSGDYSMAYLSISGGIYANTYDSLARLAPNGNGNIGTVAVKTYSGNRVDIISDNESGVTYSFNAGVGTLRFPNTTQLPLRGDKQFFISPDGNFFFGGSVDVNSINPFDFFIGVRRQSGAAPALDGLYYSAGINHLPNSFDTFYGAFKAVNGTVYEHQRYLSTLSANPIDYTASIGVYPVSPSNEYTDELSAIDYVVSRDGNFRIGIGRTPYMTLRVAVRGPVFTPPNSNPFIDPTGVINSATYAPFTAGIAHGELIAIFGKNLSNITTSAVGGQPFPKSMGGVQVKMNNRDAAIIYVRPDVVSAQVPYGITDPIIQIQIFRDGVPSNVVTAFRTTTAPGVYTLNQGGTGLGAIRDLSGEIVTESNPAHKGAFITAYMTGLGDVFPVIEDGAVSPGGNGDNPAKVTNNMTTLVDNLDAPADFAGLTPTLVALYQVNLKVPDNTSAGNVYFDILTVDAQASQIILPVAAGAASPPRQASEPRVPRRYR
jgi:uncharacterized protein (TIGR03437 family)